MPGSFEAQRGGESADSRTRDDDSHNRDLIHICLEMNHLAP